MMRFLANENFPLFSAVRLVSAGHDVAVIIRETPGAKDPSVLERAHREQRVLLTFDKDYGELIYRRGLPSPAGVVFFRFDPANPEEPAEMVLEMLEKPHFPLLGRFTVVSRRAVRQRPLG